MSVELRGGETSIHPSLHRDTRRQESVGLEKIKGMGWNEIEGEGVRDEKMRGGKEE